MTVYIMRGPSGSGKSTYARKVLGLFISVNGIDKEAKDA